MARSLLGMMPDGTASTQHETDREGWIFKRQDSIMIHSQIRPNDTGFSRTSNDLTSTILMASCGKILMTNGTPDGWPGNDVPLVVMYSPNVHRLSEVRRMMQAIGVRFLGYDRPDTLTDALNVVHPAAVMIEGKDDVISLKVARKVQANDYTLPLVRVLSEQEDEGFSSDVGPFIGTLRMDAQGSHLLVALGRLGVLPRRLAMVG